MGSQAGLVLQQQEGPGGANEPMLLMPLPQGQGGRWQVGRTASAPAA